MIVHMEDEQERWIGQSSKSLQSLLDDGKFILHGKQSIYPMNGAATTLHTAKPCHLALSKLVYGCFELLYHFFVGQLSCAVEGEKLVFQTIIYEIFGWNAFVKEVLHFCDHAIFETLV